MKFIKFLFALVVIAFIAAFAGSPYYAAYQLKQAYNTHDGEAVSSYIDFQQLQPNIQVQLMDKFNHTLTQYPLVAQLGGDALTQTAHNFISDAVSQAVTADNVTNLVNTQGQVNQSSKELAAAWAIASNKVDLQALIQDMISQRGNVDAVIKNQVQVMMDKQASELAAQPKSDSDDKPELSYCGINCFTISGEVKGYPVTLEMTRQGLFGWLIVDVVLP